MRATPEPDPAALGAFLAAALAMAAAPSPAAPPDGQIVFAGRRPRRSGRASTFCQTAARRRPASQVSHLTLCNLAQPKCQQFNLDVNPGPGAADLPEPGCPGDGAVGRHQRRRRRPRRTSPSTRSACRPTSATAATAPSTAMSNAIYCKTFDGGGFGLAGLPQGRGRRRAVCGDDSPIVNFQLHAGAVRRPRRGAAQRRRQEPDGRLRHPRELHATSAPRARPRSASAAPAVGVQCVAPGALEARRRRLQGHHQRPVEPDGDLHLHHDRRHPLSPLLLRPARTAATA